MLITMVHINQQPQCHLKLSIMLSNRFPMSKCFQSRRIPSLFSKHGVCLITWRAMCSKKLAAPLVLADSAREPASIQTPTVAAPAEGFSSVATVKPLGKLVMRVAEACLAAVAKGRTN
jgi:hypothetical protein